MPGEKLFLNKTPKDIKEKYPKVPDFSKSERVDDRMNHKTQEVDFDSIDF